MLHFLRQIIHDIKQGENIDVYLSIPFAIIIVVLGILNQVSFEIVGASILSTLALLFASLLSNRRTPSETKTSIEKLNGTVRSFEQFVQKKAL